MCPEEIDNHKDYYICFVIATILDLDVVSYAVFATIYDKSSSGHQFVPDTFFFFQLENEIAGNIGVEYNMYILEAKNLLKSCDFLYFLFTKLLKPKDKHLFNASLPMMNDIYFN